MAQGLFFVKETAACSICLYVTSDSMTPSCQTFSQIYWMNKIVLIEILVRGKVLRAD